MPPGPSFAPRDARARLDFGWLARAAAGLAAFAAASAAGCIYTSDAGLTPPLTSFYYPTGIAVSPGRSALYVVNSDFDLQFTGGTVQVLDLDQLRPQLTTLVNAFLADKSGAEACATIGLASNDQCLDVPPFLCENDILNPGPCAPILGDPANPLVKSYATIGAFGSGLVLVTNDGGPMARGARLFVPVRGDPSITYFDVDDDRDPNNVVHPCGSDFCLDCGGQGSDLRCDGLHKIGQNPYENTRDLVLPTEPIGIAASDDGLALVVAHDTVNTVSLSVNSWVAKPSLQFTLPDLPAGPTDVATIPTAKYIATALATPGTSFDYQPGFLVTYRATAELDLMRYASDSGASPPRPYITRENAYSLTQNQDTRDSRGIAVDATERKACEAKCAGGDLQCLATCLVNVPLRVFIANRAPSSLLVGEITTKLVISDGGIVTGATDAVNVYDSIPLDQGPSNIALGQALDMNHELKTEVFVVCFDSRFVFMYDPDARMVTGTFRTGRGPQALALDTDATHSFLFVAHFTDSYLGVIDLDMTHPTFGSMFASVGEPLPPKESK